MKGQQFVNSVLSTSVVNKSPREIIQNLLKCIDVKTNRYSLANSSIRPVDFKKQKIIVEFSSPNIAKPFHIGHLRSTVVGHSIYNICKTAGNDVCSMCFLGDWGTQFGVLNAGLVKWLPTNNKDTDGESIVEFVKKLDLLSLLNYYIKSAKEVELNEEFAKETRRLSTKLEQLDPEAFQIWSIVREKTVSHLETVWSQFGIKFDVIQGESDFALQSSHTVDVLNNLKSKSLTLTDESGCIYGILPPLVSKDGEIKERKIPLIKSDGSSLYILRDMAAAISRKNNHLFDQMIYVVDKAQQYHFSSLFSLLESGYGFERSSFKHISFGRVEGMSTRSGNFILLSEVLKTGIEVMKEGRQNSLNTKSIEDSEITLTLVISALVIHFLKLKLGRDIKFKWEDALKSSGRTGVNLQYNHARLATLESKTKELMNSENLPPVENEIDYEYISNDQIANSLLLELANFDDAFWTTYSEMEPYILVNYLFKLCDISSKAFKELKIQNEPDKRIAYTRFTLFWITRRILATGLETIGIKPLNQM